MADWTNQVGDLPVNYLLGADEFNALIFDNINWLAQRPVAEYVHSTTGGDYTTTSIFYLEEIDNVNMALEVVVPENSIVLCIFHGEIAKSTSVTIAFDFDVDGDKVGRHGAFARWAGWGTQGGSGAVNGRTFNVIIPLRLPAGTHTIQPVWALSNAATVTLLDDTAPTIQVMVL